MEAVVSKATKADQFQTVECLECQVSKCELYTSKRETLKIFEQGNNMIRVYVSKINLTMVCRSQGDHLGN